MDNFKTINGRLIGQGKYQGYAITNTSAGRILDFRGVPVEKASELFVPGGTDTDVLELTKGIELPIKDPWVVWVAGKSCELRNGRAEGVLVGTLHTSRTRPEGSYAVYRSPSTPSRPVEIGQKLKVIRPGVVQAMRARASIATGATKGAPADWYCTCAPYDLRRIAVQSKPTCKRCAVALQRVQTVRVLVPSHWCGPSTKMPERRAHLGSLLARARPLEQGRPGAMDRTTEALNKRISEIEIGDEEGKLDLWHLVEEHSCNLATEIVSVLEDGIEGVELEQVVGELVSEYGVLADQIP